MQAWDLFWIGLATVAISLWYARPRPPLPSGASWWARSSRSYAYWKGSWAPIMVPIGALIALVGLVMALSD